MTWLVRDVPRGLRVVEQRRVAAPAVRIGVLVGLRLEQPAARAEVLDQVGVGVLDLAAGVRADPLVVGAVEPDRVDHAQAVLLAETEVVLAERDRRVNEPGAVVRGDEVAEQNGVAPRAVLGPGDERERGLVARRRRASLPGKRLRTCARAPSPRTRSCERLGDDVDVLVVLHAHVRQLRIDRDRRVRHERPRRRRPHQQLVAALDGRVAVRDREPHVHRRVDHVLVHAGLPELVARERHLVTRAVRDDLELLVQQALVVDRLERPPHRLDVRRGRASCRRGRGRSRSRSARSSRSSPRRG